MNLYTIGGYNEVGKNMTTLVVRDEILILDMGYDMEELIDMDRSIESASAKDVIQMGIVPDDKLLYKQRDKVKGIVIGHGHLDHVGAVGKLADSYDCPILASPYTMKIVEEQIKEENKNIKNKRIVLDSGKTLKLTSKLAIEFVKVTHSIPATMLTVVHSPEGRFAYGLDFRIDMEPVLGDTVDFDRLEELGNECIKILVGDSTRVSDRGSSSTESAVKDQLQFKFNQLYKDPSAIVVTTLSSHIERLKSILEVNDGRRKVAFIGRSLKEYTRPADDLEYINLKNVEIASYRDEVNQLFEKIAENKKEWLIVCTGNQGEDKSVLKKLSMDKYPFQLQAGDHVIFSTSTIPTLAQEEGYKLNENLFICENGNVLEF